MGWPYHFVELSDAEKQARRESLDLHANIAQLSTLVPVAVVLLARLGTWLVRGPVSQRINYDVVPTSPTIKHHRQTTAGSWAVTARRLTWWLGEDVRFAGQRWGTVDQLLFGSLWAAWLLVLCFVNTGDGEYLGPFLVRPFCLVSSVHPADLGQTTCTWRSASPPLRPRSSPCSTSCL